MQTGTTSERRQCLQPCRTLQREISGERDEFTDEQRRLFEIFDRHVFLPFEIKFSNDIIQIPSERNEKFDQRQVGEDDDRCVGPIRNQSFENVKAEKIQRCSDEQEE